MHEPEPDSTNWFFNFNHIFSSNYCEDSTLHDVKIYRQQYSTDGYPDTVYHTFDNDENLARALQEEDLLQLSISESPECIQSSTVVPDWHESSNNFYIGQESGLYETHDEGSLCSSPGDRLCDGDDYSYTLEITDESEIDGEVEKRLCQMIPVPHIPRINGDIPSEYEATSDHQRLLDRLQIHDLIEHKVQGDGNCQFRALSDQFYRTPEHHKFVRQQVVRQLKAHPEIYEGYVPMGYADYLRRISKSGEWGDHVTLQAAADSYGTRILVVTSFKDTCYIEILPKHQKSKRVIYLSFWAEVHYNSIYPQGDLPPSDFKRKKKWWPFLNKPNEC